VTVLNPSRIREIEGRALELLYKYESLRAPVDVVRLALRMGIRQVLLKAFDTDTALAGMIRRQGGEGTIWVNMFDAPVRQRFTVAHEIGHWVLHLSGDGIWEEPAEAVAYRLSSPTFSGQEAEANRFAASLLMPAPLVNAFLEDGRSDPDDLAQVFDVSRQAMEIRLESLRRLMQSGDGGDA
jgi:Zn-dependent peptidase ImmA (M78 family)